MKTKRFSRALAMALVLIMVLGTLPFAAFATETAEVAQWNVTLRDDLGVNFYLSIPDSAVANAQIKLTVGNGEPITYNVADMTANGDGYYAVSTNIAAAQMADNINVVIVTDGTEVVNNNYTVAGYANEVLQNEKMSKYHDIVLNMLNYGAKAQLYFNHNTGNLANADNALSQEAVVSTTVKELTAEGSVDGISLYGTSLLFQNKIAMRYYFSAPNGVDGYTFQVGDASYEVQAKDNLYYVQINGINPTDYDNDVTLTVSDGTDNLNVTYSPMHYVTRMCNNNSASDSLKALLTAMYGYYQAACNLPDLTPEEMGYSRITMAGLGIADGTQTGNLVNNKLVDGGLDMKYLDVDVAFGSAIDASATGVKYGASAADAWDGFKIGPVDSTTLTVVYSQTNKTLKTITAAEAGVESFTDTFNLKFASKVRPAEMEGRLDFTISMWINDRLVMDHLLVGNMTNMGDYVGILTWFGGSVSVSTKQSPEEMGYTRYTMADLGIADGTYADNAVRGAVPAVGVSGGYLDVDVAFAYKADGTADSSTGIKLAHSGPASWDGFQIRLAEGDKLTVRYATSNYELFSVSTEEAGVDTFTETFNLKVALKLEDMATGGKLATISLWINDKPIKKNHSEGFAAAGLGEYAGILTWFGAGITVASPAAGENEPTEPEVTEPIVPPTPEGLGYSKITMEELGYADGTYTDNAVRTAEVAGGIDGKYLDVDVSYGEVVDGSSGIKLANTAVGSWDGIRIGLAADDTLIVQAMAANQTIFTLTAEEAGVKSFKETFNLKVAIDLEPVESSPGFTNVIINMWINDQLVKKDVSTGGVKGIGNFAGMLTWNGASVTVASVRSAEEMGFTRITMADLGYDGTYSGNAVRTAEVAGGMDGKYLDVDVSFGEVADASSGIKVGNTGASSWDGLRIGLTADGNLIVQAMGSNLTIFTMTPAEAGVESFTETFNLKFAVKYAPIDDAWTNVTINMWINDVQVKKNVTTGGINGIGNCAGMLTWNGASVTVGTPA